MASAEKATQGRLKSACGRAVIFTFNLENLFSNSHSRDDYLCQVSLKVEI